MNFIPVFVSLAFLDITVLGASYFQKCFYCAQHDKTLILKGSSWCFCVVKTFCRVVRVLV